MRSPEARAVFAVECVVSAKRSRETSGDDDAASHGTSRRSNCAVEAAPWHDVSDVIDIVARCTIRTRDIVALRSVNRKCAVAVANVHQYRGPEFRVDHKIPIAVPHEEAASCTLLPKPGRVIDLQLLLEQELLAYLFRQWSDAARHSPSEAIDGATDRDILLVIRDLAAYWCLDDDSTDSGNYMQLLSGMFHYPERYFCDVSRVYVDDAADDVLRDVVGRLAASRLGQQIHSLDIRRSVEHDLGYGTWIRRSMPAFTNLTSLTLWNCPNWRDVLIGVSGLQHLRCVHALRLQRFGELEPLPTHESEPLSDAPAIGFALCSLPALEVLEMVFAHEPWGLYEREDWCYPFFDELIARFLLSRSRLVPRLEPYDGRLHPPPEVSANPLWAALSALPDALSRVRARVEALSGTAARRAATEPWAHPLAPDPLPEDTWCYLPA